MKTSDIIVAFGGIAALFLIWLMWASHGVNFANQYLMLQGGDSGDAGQWGDTFGGFNALFGALGFAAVLGTLITQGRALAAQQRDQHMQRFESSFFQLLELLRKLREDVRISPAGDYAASKAASITTEQKGLAAFQYASGSLEFWVRHHAYPDTATKTGLALLYENEVHTENEDELGPYFRICYTILRRISQDRILVDAEKIRFGNMLRAQLTSAELKIIAFNALTEASNDFQDFVEEFHLLKYLRVETITREAVEPHYDAKAFEARD